MPSRTPGVVTTMTGAAETVPAEYMPVLEAVLGGKYAERMARVWVSNYDDFKGDESNGEWALAREITFTRWRSASRATSWP